MTGPAMLRAMTVVDLCVRGCREPVALRAWLELGDLRVLDDWLEVPDAAMSPDAVLRLEVPEGADVESTLRDALAGFPFPFLSAEVRRD